MIDNDDPEGAAFHLQQAIEKYLKGYLISKGWKLKRIHDLEDLLDYAVDYHKEFEERYPLLMTSELTRDEVQLKVEKAMEFIVKVKEWLEMP